MWLTIQGILLETQRFFYLSSPYLLFGFLVAGFLYVYFSRDLVFNHLGRNNIGSVVKAALFGIPLPLCSCGVIPTALSLRKQGASIGATLSFLISTPETGVDSISITYALIDPFYTLFRPFAAFFTAVFTGSLANLLPHQPNSSQVDVTCHICGLFIEEGHSHTLLEKTRKMLSYAYLEFLGDIARWLVVGFIIAGAISYLIPPDFFEQYLQNELLSMLVMLALGIPLYICATSTTPIAAALLLKGVNPGAVLVFMLSGPATNGATITMVFSYLGRRAGIIYLSSLAGCSLLMGYLLNFCYYVMNTSPSARLGKAADFMPSWLLNISAAILFILISYTIIKGLLKKRTHPDACCSSAEHGKDCK